MSEHRYILQEWKQQGFLSIDSIPETQHLAGVKIVELFPNLKLIFVLHIQFIAAPVS